MSKKRKQNQQMETVPVAATKGGMRIAPSFGPSGYTSIFSSPVAMTVEEVKKLYGPPQTLGTPEDVRIACDSQLEDCGVFSLLQHSFALGQMPQAQFLGYGVLQQIAQNGLIRACIETTADDMTRNWIDLKREGEKDDPDTPENEEDTLPQIAAECERLHLRRILHDAACYVGYMGGCLLFIDTGETDPDVLRLPLNLSGMSAELKNDRPLRFVVIDPINVFPGLYNSLSPLRQDYFVPKTWWIMGQEVHASRLIRMVANEVPTLLKPAYNFLGLAQAQLLWDYVMHFQECRVASQRLLSKFSLTVFKTDMANVLFQASGTDELDKRIALLVRNRSNDGVEAIDKEEEILKLETPIGGVTDVVRQALEILAAINRTPAVKLLGISPAGFNSTGESDIRNYYDHILSQQEKVLRPAIKRILDLIQIRLFGKVDKSLTFDFATLSEADQAAEAATQKTKADTMAVLLDRNIISPEECRKRLADDPDSGFSDIDADDLPEPPEEGMEEEPLPEPDVDDVDKAGAINDTAIHLHEHDIVGDAAMGADEERWITVHPNGPDATGRPALIDSETGTVKAGMGGRFNGRSIDDIPRGENPHPVTEEKYQARQERIGQQTISGSGTTAQTQAAVEQTAPQPVAHPELVGYEWKSMIGSKWSNREEGMVEGRISDWDNKETSELSGRDIVHVYHIRDEDGVVRPYGRASAAKKLGLHDKALNNAIKPYITKAQREEKQIADSLKEKMWRIKKGYTASTAGKTSVSTNPQHVYEFAREQVFRDKGKMSENVVFAKMPQGNYGVFFVGGKNAPDKERTVAQLKKEGIDTLEWKEMKALAGE